ncbi:hypothetical protein GCM10009864_33210 [Streptomyces lunalinharesii]|uniref:Uncharacterized protein n=1 Tax=Streptomyces lunalinharesii TaxID=333384 RepID=A0ABN3RWT9_9ACTN
MRNSSLRVRPAARGTAPLAPVSLVGPAHVDSHLPATGRRNPLRTAASCPGAGSAPTGVVDVAGAESLGGSA